QGLTAVPGCRSRVRLAQRRRPMGDDTRSGYIAMFIPFVALPVRAKSTPTAAHRPCCQLYDGLRFDYGECILYASPGGRPPVRPPGQLRVPGAAAAAFGHGSRRAILAPNHVNGSY